MRKFLKSLLIFVLFVSCFAMAFFVVQEDMSVADAAISKTLLVDEFECYDKGSTYYHFIDIYIESQSNIDHSSGTIYIAKTTSIKFSFSRGAHNHGATLQADGADMAGTVTFYLKNVVTGATTTKQSYYQKYYGSSGTNGLTGGVDSATFTFSNLAQGEYELCVEAEYRRGSSDAYKDSNSGSYGTFIVDTLTPTISCSIANNGITSSKFTVTASDANLTYLYYKDPNGTPNEVSSSGTSVSKTITKDAGDGKYEFYAVDKAGRKSSSYFITLDTTKPTISCSLGLEDGSYTNKPFTITASDNVGLNRLEYKLPDDGSADAWHIHTGATFSVKAGSASGLYRFRAVDNADKTSSIFDVYFDDIAPILSGQPESDFTNQPFIITASDNQFFKALYYKTPDADEFVSTTSKTKSVTADSVNGKYEFYVEDKAGNKSSIVTVYFDTSAPTLSGIVDDAFYKGTISARWNASNLALNSFDEITVKYSCSKSGSFPETATDDYVSNKTLSEDGNYLFTITDKAGNYTSYRVTLDNSKPVLTLDGLNDKFFSNSQEVEVSWSTIVGGVGTQRMNANDTLSVTFAHSTTGFYPNAPSTATINNDGLLTDEGNYLVRITDAAGNYTDYKFTIDKTKPTFTLRGLVEGLDYNASKDGSSAIWNIDVGGVGTQRANSNDSLTAFYSFAATDYPGTATTAYTRGTELLEEGYYLIRLYDTAGNYSEQRFIIDSTAPTISTISEYLNYSFVFTASDLHHAVIKYTHNGVAKETKAGEVFVECRSENFGTWTFYAIDELGNRSATQTANLYYREDFGNLEGIKNGYKVSTWFTVSLPARIFNDVAGNYTFATRDAALSFAISKEWQFRVEELANGWSYVNITNESVVQSYTNRNDLDAAVLKYASTYVSERKIMQLGNNTYPNPTDENGVTRDDALTMQTKELPEMLSAYAHLPFYLIQHGFEFTTPIAGVSGNTREISIQYLASDLMLEIGEIKALEYGVKLENALEDAYGQYLQGYYLIQESDRCGNIQRYVVYLDTDTPTLEGKVTLGNGEEQNIVFNNDYVTANENVMLYVSLSMNSIFDNIDDFSVLCISGRGLADVCYAQGDEMPMLSHENGYYGKYIINVYDRSMNYISFTIRIAGEEAVLKHTSLTNETKCSLYIDYDSANNAITSVELYKVMYDGQYVALSYDDDGAEVSASTLTYIIRTGGKYVVRFSDIFGRVVESAPVFYMKGLPSGSLSGVKANGVTKNNVSFDFAEGNGLHLYKYDTSTREWVLSDDEMSLTAKDGYSVAQIIAGTSTSNLYKFFLFVESDMNLFTEYSFEIDCIAPLATITTEGGNELLQESVTRENFSVDWNEGTARYYSKNSALGQYSETSYKRGTVITKAGTYVFTITDSVGNETKFNVTLDNLVSYSIDGDYTTLNDGSIISKSSVTLTINERTSEFNCDASNGLTIINGAKLTEDGTYSFVVKDAIGNEFSVVIIIDKFPPVPLIKATDGTGIGMNGATNKAFSVACEEANVAIFIRNGAQYVAYDGATFDEEGTYSFRMTDRMNNACTFTVTIDRTVDFSVKGTYQEIGARSYISRYSLILTANETYSRFDVEGPLKFGAGERVTEEGTYNVTIVDEVGNIETITLIIDKTAPTVQINTLNDVEVAENSVINEGFSLTCEEEGATLKYSMSGTNYTTYDGSDCTAVGTYYFIVTDFLGNEKSFSIRIDLTVTYEVKGSYKQIDNIYLSSTGLMLNVEDDYRRFDVESDNGITFGAGESVTKEGRYQITLEDRAGNVLSIEFIIDKTAPEVQITSQNGEILEQNSSTRNPFSVSVSEDDATMSISTSGVKYSDYEGTVLTDENTYYFTISDVVGNTVSFTISIDLSVSYSVRGYTYNNGTIYASKSSLTLDVKEEYKNISITGGNIVLGEAISQEGTYNVVIEDNAGNTVTLELVVDKTAPIPQIVDSNGEGILMNGKTRLPFFVAGASNDSLKQSMNGVKYSEYDGKVIEAEGKYFFIISDYVGNEVNFTVEVDSSVAFSVKGTYSMDGTTYVSRYGLTLTANEEILQFNVESDNGVYFASGERVTAEGTYNVTIVDAVGNKAEVALVIDQTAPVITASVENGGITKNVVTIQTEGADLIRLSSTKLDEPVVLEKECTWSESGTYTIIATDIAGNESRYRFTIDDVVEVTTSPMLMPGQIVSEAVTFDFDEEAVKFVTLNGVTIDYRNTFREAGQYTLTATDEQGNVYSTSWTIIPAKANAYDISASEGYTIISGTLNGEAISVENGIDLSKDGVYSFVFSGEGGEYVLEFVVDTVAPTVKITQEKKQVVFSAADKENVTYELYLDGKLVSCKPNEPIIERGSYKLIVTDELGNSSEYIFSLDYINTYGIIVIALAASLVLAAVIGMIIYRKHQSVK